MGSYDQLPSTDQMELETEVFEEEKEEGEAAEKRERWGNHLEFLLASIGLAVGTGNVWRFPYLAQKNGGGAFLLPYTIMLLVEGLPLLYLELALGQRMQKGFLKIWSGIRPHFMGLGVSQLIVSFQMTAYFPMVMCWCMYYFYLSFQNPLPWTKCEGLNNTCCEADKAQFFWYENALQATSNIGDTGGMVTGIVICWIIGWILTYLCLFKGIQSSGKAAYFTATFPYLVLTCLFVRGVTLDGALNGVKVLFTPDFSKLVDPNVWMDAAGQIFYSLSVGFGALICFGSYNPVKNNVTADALLIGFINCGTSVFSAIVVYSVLGFREIKTGIAVEDVQGGPGLAFIAYTTAVAEMPQPQLWAGLFFFMMVLLAIDSEFGTIEAFIGPLQDYPLFRKIRKEILCLIVCVILCLLGLPLCSRAGLYIFTLWDTFSVAVPLLFIGIAQCIVVSWFYGLDKICNDIEYMTGGQPHFYWKICWKYVSPAVIMLILSASVVMQLISPATYTTYLGCDPDEPVNSKDWTVKVPFPLWSQLVGAGMVLLPVLPMPVLALFYLIRARYTPSTDAGIGMQSL